MTVDCVIVTVFAFLPAVLVIVMLHTAPYGYQDSSGYHPGRPRGAVRANPFTPANCTRRARPFRWNPDLFSAGGQPSLRLPGQVAVRKHLWRA